MAEEQNIDEVVDISADTLINDDDHYVNMAAGADPFWINAMRAGTVAHTRTGRKVEFTGDMLESMADSWVGGFIKHNHENVVPGKIVEARYQKPYLSLKLDHLASGDRERIEARNYNGFSIDSRGNPNDLQSVNGTGVSILYDHKQPACSIAEGCDVVTNIEGDKTPEENAETGKTVEDIVAETAVTIDKLKGELGASQAIVAEQETAMGAMFTQEQVDTKVAEAVVAATEEADAKNTAREAVKNMFPGGMDEKVEADIIASIESGNYQKVIATLGTISFKNVVHSIPKDGHREDINAEKPTETAVALQTGLNGLNKKFLG